MSAAAVVLQIQAAAAAVGLQMQAATLLFSFCRRTTQDHPCKSLHISQSLLCMLHACVGVHAPVVACGSASHVCFAQRGLFPPTVPAHARTRSRVCVRAHSLTSFSTGVCTMIELMGVVYAADPSAAMAALLPSNEPCGTCILTCVSSGADDPTPCLVRCTGARTYMQKCIFINIHNTSICIHILGRLLPLARVHMLFLFARTHTHTRTHRHTHTHTETHTHTLIFSRWSLTGNTEPCRLWALYLRRPFSSSSQMRQGRAGVCVCMHASAVPNVPAQLCGSVVLVGTGVHAMDVPRYGCFSPSSHAIPARTHTHTRMPCSPHKRQLHPAVSEGRSACMCQL
jgi:hypothetical protein